MQFTRSAVTMLLFLTNTSRAFVAHRGAFSSRSTNRVAVLFSTAATDNKTSSGATTGAYPFAEVEQKWQKYWEENKTFKTPERDPSLKKKYILDMFPYPSGAGLHVGHPEGYTASDILSRYYRMNNVQVLHPMGWDSFGLPAEQFAIQTGTHPAVTTGKNIETFKRQLKSLGFSYDWDKEIATTDEKYYRWTQWIFLQLFKKGLATQSSIPVNWCPMLGTVLANEEVIDGLSERGNHPVQRIPLRQWQLKITKYAERLEQGLHGLEWPSGTKTSQEQWIGRSEGASIDFQVEEGYSEKKLTVFTTRPDTLQGVTFLSVAPEHPLVTELMENSSEEENTEVRDYVKASINRSDLDRTSGKEKTGVLTGLYATHPLTGEKVPIYVADYVLGGYGTGSVMGVPAHDERDFEFAEKFGVDIKFVVKPVDSELNTDEAFIENGVNFNSGEFDGLDTAACKTAVIERLESINAGKKQVNFKLRDWIFSRQRYWGEPIPIYFPVNFDSDVDLETVDPRVEGTAHTIDFDTPIAVDESELPLTLPEMDNFEPGDDPQGCLARAVDWRYFKKDKKWYARETNTMPQWAGSCWYYLRYIDNENSSEAWSLQADKDWMPVDAYIGGSEHAVLHLLYARFWHQVLYDEGFTAHPEPFHKLIHQGMILGTDGEKMSKSRGNVINPDDIVQTQGADALRLYEMFMGPLEAVKPWQTDQVQGVVRFQNRLYKLFGNLASEDVEMDKETTKVLHKTMKKVTEDIESMAFNTAISALMVLVNHLNTLDACPREAAESLALMISPFAPHLGEECWNILGHEDTLAYNDWVKHDESLCVDDTIKMGVQVNGKTRGTIEIPADGSQDDAMEAARGDEKVLRFIDGKDVKKIIFVPGKILNIIVGK